jgi:hypothetical protein
MDRVMNAKEKCLANMKFFMEYEEKTNIDFRPENMNVWIQAQLLYKDYEDLSFTVETEYNVLNTKNEIQNVIKIPFKSIIHQIAPQGTHVKYNWREYIDTDLFYIEFLNHY